MVNLSPGTSENARLGGTRGSVDVAVTGQRQGRLSFGTFELDRESGELFKRGLPLRLQEKPLQLLLLLLEHPGEIASREDLQRRLWPNGTYVDFDKGLNTAVKKLRYALGDSPDKPVFIETIPRRGYRFIAPVSGNGIGLGDALAGGTTFPASTGEAGSIDGRSEKGFHSSNRAAGSRKYWYALFAAIVLVASLVLVKYIKSSSTPALDLQSMEVTELTSDGKVREMAISP